MLWFLFKVVITMAASAAAFYVSPVGKDAAPGTNITTPFRTIAQAQAAARAYHAKYPGASVTVHLHAGTYFLPRTLHFDAQDSDTTYIGDGTVDLSGGEPITGWRHVTGNRYETVLPAVRSGKEYFEQLFVGDIRRYRPRLPKTGYYQIAIAGLATDKPGGPGYSDKGYDRFGYKPGDIRPDWHDLSDVSVLPFGTWEMSRFPIQTVDTATHTVVFAGRTVGDQEFTDFGAGKRYLVENVREALTEPGEWYLDRAAGVLTYLARPGEDPRKEPVIAPRLESLMQVTGASHLIFKHIAFRHTAYHTPKTGRSTWQAEADLPAAITVSGSTGVRFEQCAITHTGGYGIAFDRGSRDCAITGSLLADLGAGGVKIGTAAPDGTGQIDVADCRVIGGGRLHPAGIGVWIGKSAGNTIMRNEIADFYYSGVSVGWNWGYGTKDARDNRILGNHIHTIGQGVLSDMGGIYTLGGTDGSLLANNRIHDISSFSYGGWGIYFDEGSSDEVARDNVVYRCTDSPFHQHYGANNHVTNNILAYGRDAQLRRTRAEDHLSFTATRNLVYYTTDTLLGSNWEGTTANFTLDRNLYWRVGDKPVLFPGSKTLAQWQSTGQDVHSLVADPGFVAPEKGDFRLQSPTPAAKVGFVPWDEAAVGPRQGALTNLPAPVITPGFPVP